MSSSQKQFDSDSKDKIILADADIPGSLAKIILEYEDSGSTIDNPLVTNSLVSTLFNSKTQRLKSLLRHIVSGEPDEAKAILEKDSSLVLGKLEEKDFVTAKSGHKFNLYPLQAAVSVFDIQMAEMIQSYFFDKKEAYKQLKQCEWDKKDEEKWEPIFEQRDTLAHTIRDSKSHINVIETNYPNHHYTVTVEKGSLVEKELFKFWGLLDATLNEVITAGKRPFNYDLLLTTLEIYEDKLKDYFGGWCDDPRALLFVQKVIGYDGMERFMSINDVQGFQADVSITAEKLRTKAPQGRSTCFEIHRSGQWVPVNFYPLQPRSCSSFGFIIRNKGIFGNDYLGCENWPDNVLKTVKDYVSEKQQAYRTLCEEYAERDCARAMAIACKISRV